MRDTLGLEPWPAQVAIARSIFSGQRRRVAVRGCVSSGKTSAASMIAISWLFAHGPAARVFTVAPSYRQVGTNLWGELKRMVRGARRPLGGNLYSGTEWKLGEDWFALGFSTDEPQRVHGIHGPNDLLIVDDAHGVPLPIFEELENMMSSGNTRAMLLFNPVSLSGETYDCTHSKAHLYDNHKIAFKDTPNGQQGKVIIPGLLHPEQAAEWERTYGPDSNFCRVKVGADYPRQEADTLIPLDWVEAAFAYAAPDGPPSLGVDVARFGDDRTVITPLLGRRCLPQVALSGLDNMEVAGRAASLADSVGARNNVLVDGVGMGSGVVDRLRELGYGVVDVVAGATARDEARFADTRSEAWWGLREALDPSNPFRISLPRDPGLQAELTSVKYRVASDKRVRVEPKDEMKRRLGYSPDKADSLCLALMGQAMGAAPASGLSAGSAVTAVGRPDWA